MMTLGEALKVAVAMKRGGIGAPYAAAPVEEEPQAERPPVMQSDEPAPAPQSPRRLRARRHASGDAAAAWPVRGKVSSHFGMRMHPILREMKPHNGVDIEAPMGASVRSVAAGRIEFAGSRGSHGLTVIVDHGGGLRTLYAHLSDISVAVGDDIPADAVIGAVGSTGRSTGPHLHFERLQNGVAVDPGLG